MSKLAGHNKKRGRCPCVGHGQCCEVSRAIQELTVSRTTDIMAARREMEKEVYGDQTGGEGESHTDAADREHI